MWSSFLLRTVRLTAFLLVLQGVVAAAAESVWDPEVSRIINEEIAAAIQARGFKPVPRAADTELVRRIYLDVLGRIPTAEETTSFIADTSSDKHHRLIDELLLHEEMPVYWRTVVDQWLNGGLRDRDFGRNGFLAYLEEAIKTNRPWNEIARELLAPNLADERQRGAAYFLATRLNSDKAASLDRMASGVASALFGVQLQCAKCHDHPFVDQWKQDHYYGLAAFFGRTQTARIENTPIVKERAEGEVQFVTTAQEEKTARLIFLDDHVFDEPSLPEDRNKWYTKGSDGLPDVPFFSRRQILADYALRAESPFFKRALVNRLWKQLMGRGLVEPVDQMHAKNPATHPALLNRLADDFAGARSDENSFSDGFDVRRLMAGILHSDAYLRSSRGVDAQEHDDALYAVAIMKPLTPDQLATSVGIATGHFDLMLEKFEREKKKRQIDEITPAIARALYWRERDLQDFAARFHTAGDGFEASAGQALFLTYNQGMQKQLQPAGGNLVERLIKESDDEAAVREAFLTVLSRPATSAEVARAVAYLSASAPARQDRCGELIWALLCSSEFRFNH